MAIEILLLHIKRRMVPVAIETRFTQGYHLWQSRQLNDLIPVAGRGVHTGIGMDSDSCVNALVLRDPHALAT